MSNIAQQEIATPDDKSAKVRSQKIKFGTTKWLTYTAVFAALAIIMKFIGQFLTLTPDFKITLIYVVWLIAAAVLGPISGGAVCFVSDVLGSFIIPMGPISPLNVLGNTLYGVVGGLVFKYLPTRSYVVKFIVEGVVCTVLFTCLINSLSLWYVYKWYQGMSFWKYFALKRAFQPLVAGINVIITLTLIPLLIRTKLLPDNKKPPKENKKCPTSL